MKTTPECPRCGRHTIVQQSETRWTCLNCDFSKDLAHRHFDDENDRHEQGESGSWFATLLLAGVMVFMLMEVAYGTTVRSSTRPSDLSQEAAAIAELRSSTVENSN